MNAVIFSGPTLAAAAILDMIEDTDVLPPVSQGDVYRAALRRPKAIGIIDGYFEHVPSVWHKEILWAMSEGIHVFGAASMGALRAAELGTFGMIGVGEIFAAYRDGCLEDDDEVAVAHGTAEHAYRAGSDAMVNIRATLTRAVQAGIIGPGAQAALEGATKELFYPTRSYERMLELAADHLSEAELVSLRRWLPGAKVDQKRADAVAMVGAMRELLETDPGPKRISFVFEETLHWENLKWCSPELPLAASGADALVLEELQRDAAALVRATAAARALCLASDKARQVNREAGAAELLHWANELCGTHGLKDSAAVDQWLAEHRCSRDQLHRLVEGHAHLDWAARSAGSDIEAWMIDYLRWTGEYRALLQRARER
jgi:hypothetical protein